MNRNNMSYNHLNLKRAVKGIYILSRVLALRPFNVNSKNQVVNSSFNSFYSFFFCIFVTYFYIQSIRLYKNLINSEHQYSLNGITTKSMFYSNMIVFTSIYVIQNIHKRNILQVLKKLKKFIKKTRKISNEIQINYKSALFVYCCKSLTMKFALLLSAFTGIKKAINGNYFNSVMIVIPIIVIFSVSSLFYAMNVAGQFYFTIFNRKLKNISQEIKLLKINKNVTSYGRIKTDCEFSDQIDEIAIFHGELCDIVKKLVEIYQILVLLTILNIFISLVAQVCYFTNYFKFDFN